MSVCSGGKTSGKNLSRTFDLLCLYVSSSLLLFLSFWPVYITFSFSSNRPTEQRERNIRCV